MVEFHRSASRHGVDRADVAHAVDNALAVVDLDVDADPPKILVIGPDSSGPLLEVILLSFPSERNLVIHAMELRPTFYDLLPRGD